MIVLFLFACFIASMRYLTIRSWLESVVLISGALVEHMREGVQRQPAAGCL